MASIQSTAGKAANAEEKDIVLRSLYGGACVLSVFQLGWFSLKYALTPRLAMGLVPAAALPQIEQSISAAMATAGFMSKEGGLVFARGFITKYHNQKFVGLTHVLVSPLWMAIIPLQLHPDFRKNHKHLHRVLGTAFFTMSTSLMAGLVAIMSRQLTLHPSSPALRGLEGRQKRALPGVVAFLGAALFDPFLVLSAGWFSYTLIRAWLAATRRRFAEHEEWALRHIASGQWIALMRMIQAMFTIPLLQPRFGDTKLIQSALFGTSGYASWAICVACAEVAVGRVRKHRAASKAKRGPVLAEEAKLAGA